MVLHINHSNEINLALLKAVQRLLSKGIRVLNQTVLLKGINDSAQALVDLSESLYDIGVTPYYLHLLDPVAGASHFDIPITQSQAIYAELKATLPGFLVPKLVREIPGEQSKTIMS
jgi:L-lysine 2,3-aminomutase|tara:strand:+ start:1282 stop:1629 length:348 start_codon:yes stop_codon:yes gene_type:complete